MDISVIIPTYNRPKQLERCLRSLVRQNYPREKYEIIVVDDGSKDDNGETVSLFSGALQLKYLYQKNMGPASAKNLGIEYAKGDIIAYMDDDCIVSEDWLACIKKTFDEYPATQVIQGCIELPSGMNLLLVAQREILNFANEIRILNSPIDNKKYALYLGFNSAIRKSILIKYRLFFDEDLTAREDEDLYRRIKDLSINVLYLAENRAIHLCHFDPISDFRRYFWYGRGEYQLRQKWGDYPRLSYKITLSRLINKYNLFRSIAILCINKIRKRIFLLGLAYERFI